MQRSRVCIAIAAFFAATSIATAGIVEMAKSSSSAPTSGTWLAWGGQTRVHLNPDALLRFGITVADAPGAARRVPGIVGKHYEVDTFTVQDANALQINHTGKVIDGVGGGALRHTGGLILNVAGRQIDLRGFTLQANVPTRIGLALVDAAGTTWFTADHAHPGFVADNPEVFSMRDMNLRLSHAFAEALGDPSLEGYQIGGLDFRANAHNDVSSAAPEGGACQDIWPADGLTTDIQLIYRNGGDNWDGHDDSVEVQRCGLPPNGASACTASSTNGKVVIDQDSSLVNIGETAIAWHYMMSGNFPPYGNDQHPFLVWNLYRVAADGRIKQVGVSGVKHAFETVNWNCTCGDGNVIYPTCEDTYAVWNNDGTGLLGPRSELIPSKAIWGRCESVFDTNCDGSEDDGGIPDSLYDFRMTATESDLLPPLSTGARYFFEYWYIVRDDQNIYNTMGYREIQPVKSGSTWSVNLVDNVPAGNNFHLGPIINQWVDPSVRHTDADNQELVTPSGRARVAMKATDLGNGSWRYEYAVMNFDYAHAQIDSAHPNEPNLKLDSSHGFGRFSVPLPAGVTLTDLHFDDADLDAANDWTAATTSDALTWTAPTGANSLDWGMLYHFEFVANSAPGPAAALQLTGVATASEGEQPFTVSVLAPAALANDTIFANGFE